MPECKANKKTYGFKHTMSKFRRKMNGKTVSGELADTTKRDRLIKIQALESFFEERKYTLGDFSEDSIIEYISSRGLKNSSKATTITIIKNFAELMKGDIKKAGGKWRLGGIRTPKIRKKPPQKIEDLEMEKVMEEIYNGNSWYDIRNRAIAMLLLNTGMRVSEATSLKYIDYREDESYAIILGKGNKVRHAYFPKSDKFLGIIHAWIKCRPKSEFFFCAKNGKAIGVRAVQKIINSIMDNAGVRRTRSRTGIGPHLLRHTFATHLVNKNVSMGIIQEVLGHEDISTTTKYAHVAPDTVRDIVNSNEIK